MPAAEPFRHCISIHALRVEGDLDSVRHLLTPSDFYPRPPGGGRPRADARPKSATNFYPRPPGGGRRDHIGRIRCAVCHFYPRPPGGGRLKAHEHCARSLAFLSTPSGWRATNGSADRGSKRGKISIHALRVEGDIVPDTCLYNAMIFLSTPSGWRATCFTRATIRGAHISIHALRVEGDGLDAKDFFYKFLFLSTPSGWRATKVGSI